jgi:hypothetical protein
MKLVLWLIVNLIVSALLAWLISPVIAFFGLVTMMGILMLALFGYPEVGFWE